MYTLLCSPLLPSLYTHCQTAALLYSPGWRLFLTQNIKTDTTNINQTHRALPASPPALTLPRWSPVVAGGTSWDHHRSHSEELLITCLWSLNNLKGIVCWRVNSPGLDFSMFWVKLSLKWLLANLAAKFLLFKFSIFLGFQSNLILTLCKLRTEGAKPSILEQNSKKFKQVLVSKPNPSMWKIKWCLLGPKLCEQQYCFYSKL